jgi:Leucine-rich repeat (LRR) protein
MFLFPGNALAGAIPTEIGQLAQLERLDLENNQLTGTPQKTSLTADRYASKN